MEESTDAKAADVSTIYNYGRQSMQVRISPQNGAHFLLHPLTLSRPFTNNTAITIERWIAGHERKPSSDQSKF